MLGEKIRKKQVKLSELLRGQGTVLCHRYVSVIVSHKIKVEVKG